METYLLRLEQVESLFDYVGEQLDLHGCDYSNRFTMKWLEYHIPESDREKVLAEIQDMGGYCDCEVMMNCYEDYLEALYPDED